jgi:hypothetical protein
MATTKHHPRIASPTNSNHEAPAVTVPPEILAFIFMALAIPENVDDSSRQVIACSQVCQVWRNVALSIPALWTRIEIQHPASEQFSIRSRPLPIQLVVKEVGEYGTCSTNESIRRASWLTTNTSRVQGLIARASSSTVRKIISSLSPISPKISTVDIQYMPFSGEDGFPSVVDFAPNARRLTLWMVDANLDLYGNLTEISFHSLCPSQYHILPLETLVLLLQRSPRLQSLHLFHMYLDNQQATGAKTVVELAFLEYMILLEIVGVVDFLSRIFIPPSAPILGHQPVKLKTLPADDRKLCRIRSVGRQLQMDVYELDHADRYKSFILVDDNLVSQDIQPIILAITSCFALSQAKIGALSIETSPDASGTLSTPPSIGSWQTILSALPKVNAIVFHCDSSGWAPNFLLALAPSASRTHDQLLCPMIQSLDLSPCSNVSGFHPNSPISSLSLAQATVQALEARASFGASPLWILELDFGDDETTTKLKRLVYDTTFRVSVILDPSDSFVPPARFLRN